MYVDHLNDETMALCHHDAVDQWCLPIAAVDAETNPIALNMAYSETSLITRLLYWWTLKKKYGMLCVTL